MQPTLLLLAGILLAALGGELFIRGNVRLARWLCIRPAVAGLTFAAFATSSPEGSIGVQSALRGVPELSLGDVLGSNVVNVALVLAVPVLWGTLRARREEIRSDGAMALAQPLLFAAFLADGELARWEAAILLVLFVFWLGRLVQGALRLRRTGPPAAPVARGWLALPLCLLGLALLVLSGRFIVSGASDIARSLGVDEFVLGATVVAVGTSVPELAAAVVAKVRGHDEVGLGMILGSNLFNALFIVPVAALIHPIQVPFAETAVPLAAGFLAVALAWPTPAGLIPRSRGALLLALYAAFLATTFLWRHGPATPSP